MRPKAPRMPTAFEKKVYAAISRIPKGEVRTYKWVARKIGHPNSCRAVGNALNRNPYIGKVPCHRVIRSDGSIGGYAKGTTCKYQMLTAEAVLTAPTPAAAFRLPSRRLGIGGTVDKI